MKFTAATCNIKKTRVCQWFSGIDSESYFGLCISIATSFTPPGYSEWGSAALFWAYELVVEWALLAT